jgi:hypothetical protein
LAYRRARSRLRGPVPRHQSPCPQATSGT